MVVREETTGLILRPALNWSTHLNGQCSFLPLNVLLMEQKNEVVKVFNFNENQPLQVEVINQEAFFVAKDVCDILGLEHVHKATKRLDEDERLTGKIFRSGQLRNLLMVNESGLYALIMRSSKPEAKRFRKWVTSEVLPAIRQYGHYGGNPDVDRRIDGLEKVMNALMESVENLANAMSANHQEQDRNSAKKTIDNRVIDARHKAFDFVDMFNANIRHIVIDDKDWYSMNDILTNMRVRTSSGQTARKLGPDMTRKIWIYGNTHPAWFCSKAGVNIILAGSRKLRSNGYFNREGGQR